MGIDAASPYTLHSKQGESEHVSVDVRDGGVLERVAAVVVETGLLENEKVGETFQKEFIWKSEY